MCLGLYEDVRAIHEIGAESLSFGSCGKVAVASMCWIMLNMMAM